MVSPFFLLQRMSDAPSSSCDQMEDVVSPLFSKRKKSLSPFPPCKIDPPPFSFFAHGVENSSEWRISRERFFLSRTRALGFPPFPFAQSWCF